MNKETKRDAELDSCRDMLVRIQELERTDPKGKEYRDLAEKLAEKFKPLVNATVKRIELTCTVDDKENLTAEFMALVVTCIYSFNGLKYTQDTNDYPKLFAGYLKKVVSNSAATKIKRLKKNASKIQESFGLDVSGNVEDMEMPEGSSFIFGQSDYMMNSQPETAIIREEQRRRIREVLDTTLTGIDRIIVWEKGAQGKGFPKILEILRRNGSTLTTPEGLSRRYQKSLELLKKHLADDR